MRSNKYKISDTKKDKLDRIFSEYIRLRDSNDKGYCRCISCGSFHFWRDMDCGHFVNRSHMGTRFSERNCNAQCRKCNRFDEGNNIGYTKGLIRKYGIRVINDLEVKKNTPTYLKNCDYDIMIAHYKKEVLRLKKEKGL